MSKSASKLSPDFKKLEEIYNDINTHAATVMMKNDKAYEFANKILEKSEDIYSTAEQHGKYTVNQYCALENMRNGLKKWLD